MPRKRTGKTPWYTEAAGFFGPRYLAEYAPMLTEERTLAEADFVARTLRLEPGSTVLDLACGHGRHAIDLARRGCRVTGQDINACFLDRARQDARRAGVRVRWVRRDMRRTAFDGEFDAVLNLFTAFGYFEDDADDQEVVVRVARALKPGGRFLLDIINRERILREYRPHHWVELPDGTTIVTERRFDLASGRNVERRIWIARDGRRRAVEPVVRMYALTELIAMCARAGLRYVAAWGDFTGADYGLASQRCILVAERSR